MAIIWGTGGKSKNPGNLWVPFFCSSCDGLSGFNVVENYRYGQVYGIRVAKYRAKYFLVCATCDRVLAIDTKEQFIQAQEIGRRIASSNDNSPEFLMRKVAEVARWVMNNPELARAIEADLN